MFVQSSPVNYPYHSQHHSDQHHLHVSDELIQHPTIIKLQQQNFNRLLSSGASTISSSSITQQSQAPEIHSIEDDRHHQAIRFSTTTPTNQMQSVKQTSDTRRAVLHQRKQALMKAIQNINKQMEELDIE